jgi:capsular polysaccharide transport system permease protein
MVTMPDQDERTREKGELGLARDMALARAEPGTRPISLVSRLNNALAGFAGRGLLRRPDDRQEPPGALRRFVLRLRASPVLVSFVAMVLIPAATASVYLAFIASNQYEAETRFAVRAAEETHQSGQTPAMMSSSPLSALNFFLQDAQIVANYIRSRAIIDDLDGVLDLKAIFQRKEADFWARLPDNASPEQFRDYWQRMVSTYVENTSGIVTVKVRAFRRDDALMLAKAILEASEHLVNTISLRARADAMRRAEEEVRRADAQMRLALADLAQFRDSEGLIDPVKSAELAGNLLFQLMQDKIKIETELFIVQRSTRADAPGVAALRARLDSVESQIKRTKAELAGTDQKAHNLAAALVRFEELEVKRQFAEAMYGFARDGLDRARVNAEKQTVYVTVFVPPALPQDISYPLRFTYSILILIGLTIAWGTIAMICASIIDHRL